MKYAVGVDTHKNSHSIALINQVGEVLEEFAINADAEGYRSAIERLRPYQDIAWGLEGTGTYGRAFADALLAANSLVYEVPGFVTKRHRRKFRRLGKSDIQDARAIAEAVLRERDTLSRCERSDEHEATRLLFERRDRLVRHRTECVNRLRALAFRLDIDLPNDMTLLKSLDQAERACTAYESAGYTAFELVDEMKETIAELRRIHDQVATLEKRMRPFVERLAPQILSMRGVSTVVAAGLVGHTGTLHNLRNADAFAMRAGVAPIPCSSGQHQAMRLNTRGDRQLNRLLHIIALTQLRSPGHQGEQYYKRKREEGHTHRAAIRALKRRLATVVYLRLRDGASALSESNISKAA